MYIVGIDEVGRAASRRRASPPFIVSSAEYRAACRADECGLRNNTLSVAESKGFPSSDTAQLAARRFIIGVDEVGRGALAGPVTVAAVLPKPKSKCKAVARMLSGIRDSKKLSGKQREAWYSKLCASGLFGWEVASVQPSVIDRIGIAHAAHRAVAAALRKLAKPDPLRKSDFLILLDGGLYAPRHYSQATITKGDERVPLIAAASIFAKVTRDRAMRQRWHRRFPEYAFDKHKGYGTAAHCAVLRDIGPCVLHRQSFLTRII